MLGLLRSRPKVISPRLVPAVAVFADVSRRHYFEGGLLYQSPTGSSSLFNFTKTNLNLQV